MMFLDPFSSKLSIYHAFIQVEFELVRVLWRNSQIEEETWERESEIKEKYPHLFFKSGKQFKFQGRNFY